mgnify:CR=1 FL=1
MLEQLDRRLRGLAARALRRKPAVVPVEAGPLAGMRLHLGGPSPYAGDYEPALARTLLRHARPGQRVLDLGAHYGYFSLLLAKAVGPAGHVVAFEANPENARLVRANVALNGMEDRVTVEQAAVGGRDAASVELFAGRGGASMEWTLSASFATRESPEPTRPDAVRTRMVSLDGYLAGRPPVSLVKMDIEGAEAEALPAARTLLRETRPTIVLEFHRDVGWPAIVALREAGYRLETLDGEPLDWPSGPDDAEYQFVARPAEG